MSILGAGGARQCAGEHHQEKYRANTSEEFLMEIKDQQVNELDYALVTLSTAQDARCQYFSDYPDLKMQTLSTKTRVELEKSGLLAYSLCKFDVVWVPITTYCPSQSASKAINDYITRVLNQSYSKYSR